MNWHTATVKFQVQSEWGALVSLVENHWQVFQEKAVDENGAKQQGRDRVSTWPFVGVILLQLSAIFSPKNFHRGYKFSDNI